MASNIKSKPTSKESPTEPFKRALTGCVRALARKPDLEVAFAAERPGLLGGKVRLPEPPRKLGKAEAAVVRGHADSIALRLACHDPAMHRRLQPAGQQARAVFEAVEQARVEAAEGMMLPVLDLDPFRRPADSRCFDTKPSRPIQAGVPEQLRTDLALPEWRQASTRRAISRAKLALRMDSGNLRRSSPWPASMSKA